MSDELDDWLSLATDAYNESTDWYKSNLADQLQRNLANFQGKHPSGSKYNTSAYAHRSRLFRPKTRAAIRKHEAAAAAAFFGTADLVKISPEDENNEMQRISAAIHTEIMNYRLSKTIPWFRILVGAYQSTLVNKIVCSWQYWEYEEEVDKEPLLDIYGQPMLDQDGDEMSRDVVTVVLDRPVIELIPIENVRISPHSDWLDPVGSSPYLIRRIPMFAVDVMSRMEREDSKTGAPAWKKMPLEKIVAASEEYSEDRVRQQRRHNRYDEETSTVSEYTLVWIHENIMKREGIDWVYYTLGTEAMLTDPVPIEDVYLHGIRPCVIGTAVLEAHNPFPSSVVELGQQLQAQANDLANQRFDNIQLALNRRKYVRRGSQVDRGALMKSVPGGVVMVGDPQHDVREEVVPDVTGSSYHEQDRLNMDFDEVMGNFSQGSVATNRRLSETVGGMEMISSDANQMTEYTLRLFTETWVEPVLRQLMQLEVAYETDQVVLGMAADRSGMLMRYGIDTVTDEMLRQDLALNVNVGISATNPKMQLQSFAEAMMAAAQMTQVPGVNRGEVIAEIFGKLGYKDGSRFFKADEEMEQQQQAMMQAQNQPNPADMQRIQAEMQWRQQELQFKQWAKQYEIEANKELQMMRMALERDLTITQLQAKLQIEGAKRQENMMREQAKLQKGELDRNANITVAGEKEATKRLEMNFKAKMGSGI